MSNRECIQNKVKELQNVLVEMDRLDEVKEKLGKIEQLRSLTIEVFAEEESVCEMMSEYTEKEIELQKLIIKGLTEKINDVCGLSGVAQEAEEEHVSENSAEEVSAETEEAISESDAEVLDQKEEVPATEEAPLEEVGISNEDLEDLTDQILAEMKE